ncbi:hypothetical protein GEMRC1_002739 [Eukaryota sp. GEM-RC1]
MKRLFLDVDTGHDDAFALLLAVYHPDSDLLGVTTVAGNQTVAKTAHNSRRMLTLIGKGHVPVVAGCSEPLSHSLRICDEIHGSSGLDGADWTAIDALITEHTPPSPFMAISFMYNTLKSAFEEQKERFT